MADHLVTSQTGCHTSLFKTSDISALGKAPYPPNTGRGPRGDTPHTGDLPAVNAYIGPRSLACPTPDVQPDGNPEANGDHLNQESWGESLLERDHPCLRHWKDGWGSQMVTTSQELLEGHQEVRRQPWLLPSACGVGNTL